MTALTVNWQEIPKGYFAIPVWDCSDEENVQEIALQTYRRTVPRTFKNGRRVGSDWFGEGATYILDKTRADDIPSLLKAYRWDREEAIGLLTAQPEQSMARYGQFTGRCGCCHHPLTDDKSKLIGIGPECRGYR